MNAISTPQPLYLMPARVSGGVAHRPPLRCTLTCKQPARYELDVNAQNASPHSTQCALHVDVQSTSNPTVKRLHVNVQSTFSHETHTLHVNEQRVVDHAMPGLHVNVQKTKPLPCLHVNVQKGLPQQGASLGIAPQVTGVAQIYGLHVNVQRINWTKWSKLPTLTPPLNEGSDKDLGPGKHLGLSLFGVRK